VFDPVIVTVRSGLPTVALSGEMEMFAIEDDEKTVKGTALYIRA
jgi:hypothetical protein